MQSTLSSSGRVGSAASRWLMFTDICPWVMSTPFGSPVVPPVYCSVARSSGDGSGSGSRCAASSAHAASERAPAPTFTRCGTAARCGGRSSGSTVAATSVSYTTTAGAASARMWPSSRDV
ncbi:MAG: hypothetical protein M5U08_02170 [Burkholderiales bacterium]|nr:hypothetical protein [Burkholderiales bacterium]